MYIFPQWFFSDNYLATPSLRKVGPEVSLAAKSQSKSAVKLYKCTFDISPTHILLWQVTRRWRSDTKIQKRTRELHTAGRTTARWSKCQHETLTLKPLTSEVFSPEHSAADATLWDLKTFPPCENDPCWWSLPTCAHVLITSDFQASYTLVTLSVPICTQACGSSFSGRLQTI